MNWQIFEYFWLAIGAGTAAGVLLSFLGCHLNAKDQSVQMMCMSQGAGLGVLLGLLINLNWSDAPSLNIKSLLPWLSGFFTALFIAKTTDKLTVDKTVSRNTYFTVFFTLLIASNGMITRLFPSLESHFSQVFFGDLATIPDQNALTILVVSLLFMLVFLGFWRRYTIHVFECSILGTDGVLISKRKRWEILIYEILVVAFLCACIQTLGFLFTVAHLFLPTVTMHLLPLKRIRSHFIGVGILAAAAIPFGFGLSLSAQNLPTVPTILILEAFVGLLLWVMLQVKRTIKID